MQQTGHSTINLGPHLDAEIDLSNASDIHYEHPLNNACTYWNSKYGL